MAKEVTFEGKPITSLRGSLQAVHFQMKKPRRDDETIELTVTARVAEIRIGGKERLHVLKVEKVVEVD
jgi:hypothetical protein